MKQDSPSLRKREYTVELRFNLKLTDLSMYATKKEPCHASTVTSIVRYLERRRSIQFISKCYAFRNYPRDLRDFQNPDSISRIDYLQGLIADSDTKRSLI